MNLLEETVNSKTVYSGRVISLVVDDILLPDGKPAKREVVEHNGGVCVIAEDNEGNILFVKQFRYPYKEIILEVPAGKRDSKNEDPLLCGKRELKEEVGATASRWMPLGEIIPSPGCYGEKLYLFLARGLEFGETHMDEDEFLRVSRLPLTDLIQGCISGEIQDGKTVCAALKAKYIMGF